MSAIRRHVETPPPVDVPALALGAALALEAGVAAAPLAGDGFGELVAAQEESTRAMATPRAKVVRSTRSPWCQPSRFAGSRPKNSRVIS
jgi:hypothetical protein